MVKTNDEVDEFRACCLHGELMVNTTGGIWPLSPSLVGLKILVISGDNYNQVIGEVSRELVYLRWFQIGQRNLPSGLLLKKLRVLELYEGENHLEELWGETDSKVPVHLRQLVISGCWNFRGFPNSIEQLKYLNKIVIIEGFGVKSLPYEFCLLQSLEYLVLTGSQMVSLPSNFGNLSHLRHLCLSMSSELRRLPVSFKKLMLLEHLNLLRCSQLTFTSDDYNFLENITKLEFLDLGGCEQMEELPRHITNQAFLR
ncbi:hypothetical protein SUGI_0683060 [Cryptomeria japonica]|nr:hypothetical protein SUGI_0683060 [Cryptomeria japonica]